MKTNNKNATVAEMANAETGRIASGKNWTMHHGDCIEEVGKMEAESVGYSVFSPPFASLYTYTDDDRDMGNCLSHEEFFEHFSYLTPELFRVLQTGRLLSFHCMNLPLSKERDGVIGLRDFRGKLIAAFEKAGFVMHSEVCIWKDPVTAMQRTKAIGLLHKQIRKDSCMSRQGIADYLVTMGKRGINANPVSGLFDRWIGDPADTPASFLAMERANRDEAQRNTGRPPLDEDFDPSPGFTNEEVRRSIDVWQRYASPVWMDIDAGDTLQYTQAREENDERHICPLQLGVIRRGMELWSNPGDLVLSPFAGIGSEGHVALEEGRRFVGVELKGSYYEWACRNLARTEKTAGAQAKLFA